jgi:spore germination protein
MPSVTAMNAPRRPALPALVTLLLGLLLAPIGGPDAATGAGPQTDRSVGPLSVEGYVFGSSSGARAYRADREIVDVVGVDGVTLTADADDISPPDPDAVRVLRAAHRHGDTAELLVSNYSNAIGDFDPALAHRMLGSVERRQDVVDALADVVRRDGWDGVQVDLESLDGSDRAGLASFVRSLRAALPEPARISMAVMAEGSGAAYREHGYPLARLDAVDRFVLMAYDQHGPGWSGPGPVGALPWAIRTCQALVRIVGAARTDLGIAGYGYLWTSPTGGHQVTDVRARQLADGHGHWHARPGEWSARLPGGGILWWSDSRSFQRRTSMASDLGLHGVAVWQLGSSDRLRG